MSNRYVYDTLYLDTVDLLARVEKIWGTECALYGFLEAARVDLVECAPAGWTLLGEEELPDV